MSSSSSSSSSTAPPSASGKSGFVENVVRRTWDTDDADKAEEERLVAERNRELHVRARQVAKYGGALQARSEGLGFLKRVGQQQVVSVDGPASQQGGFYCDICDRVYKDSNSFLDHVNSRQHLNKAGTSYSARRATVEEVRERIAFHKRNLEEAKRDSGPHESRAADRLAAAEELEKERRRERKRRKKERKAKKRKAKAEAAAAAAGRV